MAKKKSRIPTTMDMPSPVEDRKWKVEAGMRTLREADEIRKDKALMKDIKKCAEDQVKSLKKV